VGCQVSRVLPKQVSSEMPKPDFTKYFIIYIVIRISLVDFRDTLWARAETPILLGPLLC
jgi:hypothetical protein